MNIKINKYNNNKLNKNIVNKKLKINVCKTGGRNNTGKMTMYTLGGGVKKKYRLIDFKRSNQNSFFINNLKIQKQYYAFVTRIEKDPYRSSFIALICYPNGILSYIIATEKMKIGSKIYNYTNFSDNYNVKDTEREKENNIKKLKTGNTFNIGFLPTGILINNIELYPQMGSVLNRAAGVWAQIVKSYDKNYVQVKLKSGEHRLIHKNCRATIGVVSNIYNNQIKLTKAGQSRLLGIRPVVRGRAMNPVDHPHGGRTNGGTAPKTPWGFLTKGKKTRNAVKSDRFIVIKRSKK